MIDIQVTSKKFNCSIKLNKKVTVIRGDSGRGKTMFYKAVSDNSGAYKITINGKSDSEYELLPVPSRDWYKYIDMNISEQRKCIYVIDDESFVATSEFAHLFSKDKFSFYIIINRFECLSAESFGQIPYSIDEVYNLVADGKEHYLVPYFKSKSSGMEKAETVLTEDSNSGYQFFQTLNTDVISARGRDKISDVLNTLTGTVILLADTAALGSCYELIYKQAEIMGVDLILPDNYLSFEYLLLTSNMFRFDLKDLSDEEICSYISHEQLLENKLVQLTKDKPYSYKKSRISVCYTEDCCARLRKEKCDKGISGNKVQKLFENTEFESLICQLSKKI